MSGERLIFAQPPKPSETSEPVPTQKRRMSERQAQRLFLQHLFLIRRLVGHYWARGGTLSVQDAQIALNIGLADLTHPSDPINHELIAQLNARVGEERADLDRKQKYHFELYKDWFDALQKEQEGDVIDE